MSLFRRLFTFGKSEAHAVLDQLEDPAKMAEQGIRDLRKDLGASLQSLAQVKAQAIRAKREFQNHKETAADYEQKAMLLLKRAEGGHLDAAEADRLATEALRKREQAVKRASEVSREVEQFDSMTGKLENNIQGLKSQIAKWENELSTLKARAQVGKATRKINEQLARVDSSGTISMLERMRDRVQEEETLAEAYGDMAQLGTSVDDDINAALGGTAELEGAAALEALKAKMSQGALPGGDERKTLPLPPLRTS